jgi:hypothetical protein
MSIFSISGVCDRCVVRMHWKPGLYLIYPGFKAQTLIANRDLQKEGCLATGLEAASSRRRLLGKGDQ